MTRLAASSRPADIRSTRSTIAASSTPTRRPPSTHTRPFTIAIAFRRNVVPNVELWEEACYEDNTLSMEHFRGNGYGIYPGITGAEARSLRQAFESRGGAR